jgi:hypothetical protein
MGWVLNATFRPLYPRERPGTHCTGGWCVSGSDWMGPESLPPPSFEPGSFWPATSRYTDWAIAAGIMILDQRYISCIAYPDQGKFNPLKPNDIYIYIIYIYTCCIYIIYICCTAPLTSRRCNWYTYSTNTGTEYFKHALHSPFFFFLFKVSFIS